VLLLRLFMKYAPIATTATTATPMNIHLPNRDFFGFFVCFSIRNFLNQ
jgi:hypothetical protein